MFPVEFFPLETFLAVLKYIFCGAFGARQSSASAKIFGGPRIAYKGGISGGGNVDIEIRCPKLRLKHPIANCVLPL